MSAPVLSVRDLHAGYGAGEVLHGLELDLRPGETLAVAGPNAAGKSTLVRVLAGALRPRRGSVHLGGTDLAALRARDRGRAIAVVPQAARTDLDFTVREMVALGRAPHAGPWGAESARDREAIARALEAADLAAVAARPYSLLSGGERQRTLIARALAQQAPVLLLDEPTAHLDLSHRLLVLDAVRAHAARGGSALVVLHDLGLAARLDRMAILDGGRIVACGAPREVLTPERLRLTWGVEGELAWSGGVPSLRLLGRA